MITRKDYQNKRKSLLSKFVDCSTKSGLEIGAADLPTVLPRDGNICYADFRSKDEMISLWNLDPAQVCDVDLILQRSELVSKQLSTKYDYIIACHVLEHIPNPIGYILDLGSLLKSDGIIFLAIPDRRHTFDCFRPLTSIHHLVVDSIEKPILPSLEHIIEFVYYHRKFTSPNLPLNLDEIVKIAEKYLAEGSPDVHCHVWEDWLFYEQILDLITSNFLSTLHYEFLQPTLNGYNEFTAIFKNKS